MKKLIHEIHRRSLWQILGVYVLGSWLVLQVVDTLADALNLPEWAGSLAVFLLIVGLPIVLATAFVQEGVVDREGGGDLEPDTTAGGTSVKQEAAAGKSSRGMFTWRNAILGGGAAFALWGVVAAVWVMTVGPPASTDGTPAGGRGEHLAIESIAVLAFADMSPEGDQEHFGDGIAEEILDGLARVPGLKVAARSSSFQYKGQSPDVRDVGRDLGVQTVLEGSVRKSEGSLRITVQLISAEDGFHLWSETYDRRDEDIFSVQEDISRSILAALDLDVEESQLPSFEAPAGGIEAHDLFLLGLGLFRGRSIPADVEEALSWFQRAVELDPLYARAHGGVAVAYAVLPQWTDMSSEEGAAKANEAAARAIELDPELAEPHQALCQSVGWNEWRWEEAEAECERAVELSPSSETSHHWHAEILMQLGRYEEAHAADLRALELSPRAPVYHHIHAWSHNMRAEYDSAAAIERELQRWDPDNVFSDRQLLIALFGSAYAGDREELTRTMLRSARTELDSVNHMAFVAAYLDAEHDPSRREQALALMSSLNLAGGFNRNLVPLLYTRLGDEENALAELERMLEIRDVLLPETLAYPDVRTLAADPRYQASWAEVFGTLPMDSP